MIKYVIKTFCKLFNNNIRRRIPRTLAASNEFLEFYQKFLFMK